MGSYPPRSVSLNRFSSLVLIISLAKVLILLAALFSKPDELRLGESEQLPVGVGLLVRLGFFEPWGVLRGVERV